jgi:hypothetical protein
MTGLAKYSPRHVLVFVRKEKFRTYMLGQITFNVTRLHFCNTCCIILIDNCGSFNATKTTQLLDMVSKSAQPNTFTCSYIMQ